MFRFFLIFVALAAICLAPAAEAAQKNFARPHTSADQIETIVAWTKARGDQKVAVLKADFAKALGFRSDMVELRTRGIIDARKGMRAVAVLASPQPECAEHGCVIFMLIEPRRYQLFWLVDMSGKTIRTVYHWNPKRGVDKTTVVPDARHAAQLKRLRAELYEEASSRKTAGN